MSTEMPYDIATVLNICGSGVQDEILDTYTEICTTLSTLQYTAHVTELDYVEMLVSSQAIGREEGVDAVRETMYTAIEEVLAQLGIEIDPDIRLELLARILGAYGTFDPTEYPQTMLDIVEDSEDPIECCTNVLEFITAIDASEWYNYVTDVTPEFISNLRMVLLAAIDDLPVQSLRIDRDFQRRRKLVQTAIPNTEMVGYTPESRDLHAYYHMHHRRLQELSNESAVVELVTLAAIADHSPEGRLEALDAILETHISDPDERIRYNGLVSRTKRDLEHVIYQ